MKYAANRLLLVSILLALFFFIFSCSINSRDIVGIYAGTIIDLSDKSTEYFLHLYENNQYALRKLAYEEGSRSSFRKGTWKIDNTTLILMADGEKDIRFRFERGSLRIEAAHDALSMLAFDTTSLRKISR